MAVMMDGRWFPYVESSNKKEGKKEAADVALRVLMAEGSYQQNETPSSVCILLLILLLLCCCFDAAVLVMEKAVFSMVKSPALAVKEGSPLGPYVKLWVTWEEFDY